MITILVATTLIISLFFPSKRKEAKTTDNHDSKEASIMESNKKVLNKVIASN